MIDAEPSWSRELAIDQPRTLLYVDDHAVDLALMRALLSQRPAWRLNMACDGEAACMIAKREPHHLLLLDIWLPDGSGADLLSRLRALPGLDSVPAIAVTSDDFPRFADAGFRERLPKPLDLRLTLRRLDHFLGETAAVAAVAATGAAEAPALTPDSTPVIAGPGRTATAAAAVAGRLIDRVKAQAQAQAGARPPVLPALRPVR